MTAPYLRQWLDPHPDRNNPEAYVFVGIGTRTLGKPLEYQMFRKIIKDAAKKSRNKEASLSSHFKALACNSSGKLPNRSADESVFRLGSGK